MCIGSRRRNGATTVELAVVAPVMFLLIFGLFEFTRMVWIQQAITNAAREGGRKAVLATTSSKNDVDAEVRQYLIGTITSPSNVNKVRITMTPANISGLPPHEPITTRVAVSYSDVAFYAPMFLSNAEIHGTVTMERE